MRPLFLGVDVGLSGVRAAVLAEDGAIAAEARRAAACDALAVEEIRALVLRTLRDALAGIDGRAVAAMAVCAFGPAPVLMAADGEVIARLRLLGGAGADAGGGDDLAARILAHRRAHPGLWARAAWLCDLTGCLVHRLTGVLVMDAATRDDYAALGVDALPARPPARAPAGPAGGLTAAAADALGLPSGLPVATGCYDSTADLAACGFGPERPAAMVLGSTLVLGRLTPEPLADAALRSVRHVGEGWFSGGWTNAAGAALDLARGWLRPPPDGPERGADGAGAVPLVLPHFAGERAPLWDGGASGAILGLTQATSPADLHRAVREGVALSALDLADRLERQLGPAGEWVATGGGTRNAALVQDLADALAAPVGVPALAGRAVGPAALAARMAGRAPVFPIAARAAPRPERSARFRRRLALYRRAQAALAPLFRDLEADRTEGIPVP
jgi:sugar (pentulose or hexulose) kinase